MSIRRHAAGLMRAVGAMSAFACVSGSLGAQAVSGGACPPAAPGVAGPRDSSQAALDSARPAIRSDTGAVDIVLLASASVREVRFNRQPEIRVRLCGGLDSVRVVERRNLPDRVVVGQTYRDVHVVVEVLGRVNAACLARWIGVQGASNDSTRQSPAACVGGTVSPAAAGATPPRPRDP